MSADWNKATDGTIRDKDGKVTGKLDPNNEPERVRTQTLRNFRLMCFHKLDQNSYTCVHCGASLIWISKNCR